MRYFLAAVLSLLPLCSFSLALNRRHPNLPPRPAIPPVSAPDIVRFDKSGAVLPPLNKTYFFDQLIDHTNPSRGTFKQRFWTSWQEYEPGGPIILMTPGEVNADGYIGYLTNATINGLVAEANNGTTIILEHRFFGLSNPIGNLKDESLKLLNIDQAAKDLSYFARNVKLPQPGSDNLTADKVPWLLIGGSYAGALVSWTFVDQPGVFWAGYASSAVVEAITDYWAYFEPIRQHMPQNCSADIEAVISHIDQVFTSGSLEEIQEIKNMFGMGDVTHLDDAAGALANILFDWQSLQPYTGANATFWQSCNALEVKNGVNAPAAGWGLEHALPAFASYFKKIYLPALCDGDDPNDCLGTYNASQSFYTNTTIDNADRSWTWMTCNEVGFFQDGAPPNWPTLVTRLVQPSYFERQCSQFFPTAFPKPPTPNVEATNAKYEGWNVNLTRVFVANGRQDPWREATLSSDFHNRLSTPSQPIYVGNGFHCSDLIVKSAVDPTIKTVMEAGVATLSNWLAEWPSGENSSSQKAQALPVPPPPAFSASSIPDDVVSATPEAVPAVATQAITVSGTGTVSSESPTPGVEAGDESRKHAVLDGMIRMPLIL